jgi:hypothetical protein
VAAMRRRRAGGPRAWVAGRRRRASSLVVAAGRCESPREHAIGYLCGWRCASVAAKMKSFRAREVANLLCHKFSPNGLSFAIVNYYNLLRCRTDRSNLE